MADPDPQEQEEQQEQEQVEDSLPDTLQETEADQQRGGKRQVPSPDRTKPVEPSVGMEDLQRQLREADERTSRAEAQARALAAQRDQAIANAQEAQRRGISSQELMLEDQLKSMAGQLDSLTEQQATAWNEGDFTKASQINRKMQELTVAHGFAHEKKLWLTQQREAQQRRPSPEQVQEPQDSLPPGDSFEAKVQGKYSPGAISFLRKHQDLVRADGSLKRTAIDAHEAALDAGFTVDTDGYYRHIEQVLTAQAAPADEAISTPRRGAPTVAAPVSRGNVRVPGGAPSGEPLPWQRQKALEQGVDPKEWVAHYNRLLAEGKISPVKP